ncbi:hypothetical protein BD289DRAFT_128115 [Coniella lustricola]|uniref:Uncharacterized protein n=1 Tax=Coniella lustricola TaxID=2025994 RepID=A0A2T2ZW51_9PEZI|nr:hypothetical protein BD289DRAFT_128115 [Coniella lustricola]
MPGDKTNAVDETSQMLRRLYRTLQHLDDMGFMPRWEHRLSKVQGHSSAMMSAQARQCHAVTLADEMADRCGETGFKCLRVVFALAQSLFLRTQPCWCCWCLLLSLAAVVARGPGSPGCLSTVKLVLVPCRSPAHCPRIHADMDSEAHGQVLRKYRLRSRSSSSSSYLAPTAAQWEPVSCSSMSVAP